MRVLVTGGNGFLGKTVVEKLRDEGHKVFVPRSTEYDLRTLEGVKGALVGRPEAVIHLAAAVGGIGANQANPGRFIYENVVMGSLLMEQSRLAGVKKFVTIGTACEYPDDAPLPLREESIWDGYPAAETAPYGIAKRTLLAMGQAYRAQYGMNVVHVIPTNLFGPRDNFDPKTSHVIPGLIARFSEAKHLDKPTVTCWGTGKATREFLYVTDAADAIVQAMHRYDDPWPVNIGTGVETPLSQVAEKIAELYDYTGEIFWDTTQPDGTPRRCMDVSRAEHVFGFRATTLLDVGLARTIAWYEA